jgi:LPXTG-motif cell wall-anchored protein
VTVQINANGVDFIFYKVGDSSAPLSGVVFTLNPWSDTLNDWDYSDAATLTETSAVSTGEVDFPQLLDGTYLLTETKTADTYALPAGEWKIVVNTSTQSVDITAVGSPPAFQKPTTGSYTGKYVVQNYHPYTMPMTGGSGTLYFTIGGIVLVGLAVILFLFTRKKKDEDDDDPGGPNPPPPKW